MTDAQIAFMARYPSWMHAVWALGVWGSVLGSILLLLRSKWAFHAFAVSIAGGAGRDQPRLPDGPARRLARCMPLVIVVICAFSSGIRWTMTKPGRAPLDGAVKPLRRPALAEEVAFVRGLVLYEDAEILALNKPSGLSSQGGRGQVHTLDELLWAFAKPGKARPRLIHRLDRDTSGVILTAKTSPPQVFSARP
jgi:hypothetical protein